MKIVLDDEAFIVQQFGGVSRLFAELIKRMDIDPDIQLHFSSFYTENEYLLPLHKNRIKPLLKNKRFPTKGKLVRFFSGLMSHPGINKIIQSGDHQIFHPTFYADYYLRALKQSPQTKLVYTVHDLIHERMPDVPGNAWYAGVKEANIRLATHIIVVSEHTKQDLLELYPFVKPEQVTVIHLGYSLTQDAQQIVGLPSSYILYVGERRGYKNFNVLLQAFQEVNRLLPDVHLVCCGGLPFSASEIQEFNRLQLNQRIQRVSCSDAELKFVYQNALAFIFPSTYEGFGIPVLEAFGNGTPAILSRASSLPEVGGNAAVYFDPANRTELSEQIINVIQNKELKEHMRKEGFERLKSFSWDKHYQATKLVYQSVWDENNNRR